MQEHGFTLQARAAGEPLDPARYALGADVRGVTLHRLQVAQTSNGWEATVVLDVRPTQSGRCKMQSACATRRLVRVLWYAQ